ncbi:MAG: PEGA domain-containing protein [Myxococcota bacterium]
MMTTPRQILPLTLLCTLWLTAAPAWGQEQPTALPSGEAPAAQPAEPPPPVAQPTPPPQAQPAPAPTPGPAPTELPPASPSAGVGALEIHSDVPGADVLVDGQPAGKTPVRVDNLTAGPHRVQVTREGGAPLIREVTVQDGLTVRMDVNVGSGPNRQPTGTLGNAAQPPPPPPAKKSSVLPGGEFFSTFVSQPWAWIAGAFALGAALVAAILWSSTPDNLPLGIKIPGNVTVSAEQWRILQFTTVGIAIVAIVVTIGLFIWPSLPFAKFLSLPDLSKMMNKKDEKPAQPEQQQSPGTTSPAPSAG